jgi:hypothetical protein
MFQDDVDGKVLKNTHLLPRRNWCGLKINEDGETPFELEVVLNVEVNRKDPAGKTKGYSLKIPTLTVVDA